MSDLYEELAGVATSVLSEFGKNRDILVHKCSQKTVNPVAGTVTGTYATQTAKGVVTRVDAKLMSDVKMVGNSSTMNVDKMVLLPPVDTSGAPMPILSDDLLEFDGFKWAILKLDPISPAGVLVATKIWVRR